MKTLIPILALSLLLFSCAEIEKTVKSDWSGQMNRMAQSYNELLPYLYDAQAYSHPTNKYTVRTPLLKISQDAKTVSNHIGNQLSGNDPFFRLGLKQLRLTTQHALESFDEQHFTYSQQLAQSSISFCFKCHLQSSGGPEITLWSQFEAPLGMDPVAKSEILVATRQFKEATKTLKDLVLSTPSPKKGKLNSSLKKLVFVSVKYSGSPNKAFYQLKDLEKSRASGQWGKPTRALISTWKSSLKTWSSLVQKNWKVSLEDILRKDITPTKDPDKAFIFALRESLILHEGLKSTKPFDKRAKIYYRLGYIYSLYPELGFWDLPEVYFESCIRMRPHSELALKCYQRLEDQLVSQRRLRPNVILLYKDEQDLKKLKVLAGRQVNAGPRK